MAASSLSKKKITLRSSDGVHFEADEAMIEQSPTIRCVIDENKDNVVTLSDVDASIVARIVEYCKKHGRAVADEDLESWDSDFISVDDVTLYRLLQAAKYLEIEGLLDLAWDRVAEIDMREIPPEILASPLENKESDNQGESSWAFD